MKRHRVTVELEIDIPEKMTIEKAIEKLKTPSASVSLGSFKVLKDEPTPEELLPYEQYDNEKIAIRNAILEVAKKNGYDFLCVAIAVDGHSSDRLTRKASRPMKMAIWAKATHPFRHAGRLEFRIRDGVIWDYPLKTQLSPLADPDFKGLMVFLKEYYYHKKRNPNDGYYDDDEDMDE